MAEKRKKVHQDELRNVVGHFRIPGDVTEAGPYGTGHINDTFSVTLVEGARSSRYILQRINKTIFLNIPALMENIVRVTTHIRDKLKDVSGSNPDREVLTVIPTEAGGSYWKTPEGDYWRAYLFIEGARTVDVPETVHQIYEAACAFARFQQLLSDLPCTLHETIPAFHDTPKRFAALETAISEDTMGRAGECAEEIAFALEREDICGAIVEAMDRGDVPNRVTHNDTKINNVMLDNENDEGICVIDLDTVMPGSVLYDFGDQVRSAVGHFRENQRDIREVRADMQRFENLVRGYLAGGRDFLCPAELELLPLSGILMTYECGIRFLADYLQGDTYFKVSEEGENLRRARTQFALVRDLERKMDDMRRIVDSARSKA